MILAVAGFDTAALLNEPTPKDTCPQEIALTKSAMSGPKIPFNLDGAERWRRCSPGLAFGQALRSVSQAQVGGA